MNNCHDPKNGKFCEAMASQKYSRGVMGKGKESYGFRPKLCGKSVGPGADYCAIHEKQFTKMQIENARRRHAATLKKGLTASVSVPYSSRVEVFACHSPSCAPPPAGTGGSTAYTSQMRHAALIEKIRTGHESALAQNRAARQAARAAQRKRSEIS